MITYTCSMLHISISVSTSPPLWWLGLTHLWLLTHTEWFIWVKSKVMVLCTFLLSDAYCPNTIGSCKKLIFQNMSFFFFLNIGTNRLKFYWYSYHKKKNYGQFSIKKHQECSVPSEMKKDVLVIQKSNTKNILVQKYWKAIHSILWSVC